jgi:pyridoxine kinase
VVHGYVGNKAAVFPLQLHGVEVDPLNVVQFSNHTGYKVFKGSRMQVDEFNALIAGLRTNGLLQCYNIILSGYVGNMDILSQLATEVETWLREGGQGSHGAGKWYVCDPVCGDHGKLYVSETVLPVYRERLIPLSWLVTPNGFEASVLSGIQVDSVAKAREAADWFHRRGPSRVLIKSFKDPSITLVGENQPALLLLGSEKVEQQGGEGATVYRQFLIEIPEIDAGFVSGTGDAFAALVLGHLTTETRNVTSGGAASDRTVFCSAVHAAVASIHGILTETVQTVNASDPSRSGSFDKSPCGVRELALIANPTILLRPTAQFNVVQLE